MTLIDDANAMKATMPYVVGAATVAGAVDGFGREFWRQRNILNKPDEYITNITGEVERKKGFNTKFFKGTQEAADLANQKLDDYLQKATDFAKGGKYDFMSIFKKTAVKGATFGAVALGILGLSVMINQAIRGVSMTVAEGINEAKK